MSDPYIDTPVNDDSYSISRLTVDGTIEGAPQMDDPTLCKDTLHFANNSGQDLYIIVNADGGTNTSFPLANTGSQDVNVEIKPPPDECTGKYGFDVIWCAQASFDKNCSSK